jgi:hypothetical protein
VSYPPQVASLVEQERRSRPGQHSKRPG